MATRKQKHDHLLTVLLNTQAKNRLQKRPTRIRILFKGLWAGMGFKINSKIK